ncbi:MAG: zf-TFIIB domain-containing protein [Bacteroidota bacterium]
MNCPKCHVNLLMSERNGIEIDYCPNCRGVWLDRGELDKIIERSVPSQKDSHFGSHSDHHKHSDYKKNSHYSGHHHKKKGGFLDDLFDF